LADTGVGREAIDSISTGGERAKNGRDADEAAVVVAVLAARLSA
jgi:hypothetical protein